MSTFFIFLNKSFSALFIPLSHKDAERIATISSIRISNHRRGFRQFSSYIPCRTNAAVETPPIAFQSQEKHRAFGETATLSITHFNSERNCFFQ
ncbi:MAG: hypothetical protein KAI38_05480, partial [Candidatus Latescibacteria bacterium]|nr:hypothetical protein [Candidatus Latescibacterota bacterium]